MIVLASAVQQTRRVLKMVMHPMMRRWNKRRRETMQGLGGSCRSVPPPAVVWRYMVTSIIIIFTNKLSGNKILLRKKGVLHNGRFVWGEWGGFG